MGSFISVKVKVSPVNNLKRCDTGVNSKRLDTIKMCRKQAFIPIKRGLADVIILSSDKTENGYYILRCGHKYTFDNSPDGSCDSWKVQINECDICREVDICRENNQLLFI